MAADDQSASPIQTPPRASAEQGVFLIEQGKRLSESALWRLGRGFFDEQGHGAWSSNVVPSDITSSPFIAHSSARVVLSYLRDCLRPQQSGAACAIDPAKPIYIVELASGSGRFSILFLKQFMQLKAASSLKSLDVRFVMTDFTLTNIRTWMEQPWFQPFLESGVLDFALFDMEQSEQLVLLRSGETLAPGNLANPLVVLASYALCVVPHDAFRTSESGLQEGLVTIHSRKAQRAEDVDVKRLSELIINFNYQKIEGSYYKNPEFDRILDSYQAEFPNQTFLFPICPLRCIERLINMAAGRLLMLVSDTGFALESELKNHPKERMLKFYGSPVVAVNFHLLKRYFQNLGGQAFITSQPGIALRSAALILGGGQHGAEQFMDTELEFEECMNRFGPSNFDLLRRAVSQRDLIIEHLLELLRLSCWDPQVFLTCAQALPGQIFFAQRHALSELRVALEKVWDNFHPISGDLPFELARAYLALNLPQEAIHFCELSLKLFGEHAATRFNLGLCHYRAGNLSEAVRCFDLAIEQKPDFSRAQVFRGRAQVAESLPPESFLATSEKQNP